jgi:hypothetical protein
LALYELSDLNIDSLSLTISNIEGHEHRIRPIAARAAAIFAERLEHFCAEAAWLSGSRNMSGASALPVNVDLRTTTDEHAASSVANAWLQAVALRLR